MFHLKVKIDNKNVLKENKYTPLYSNQELFILTVKRAVNNLESIST